MRGVLSSPSLDLVDYLFCIAESGLFWGLNCCAAMCLQAGAMLTSME
jgi:hypothetical protein